MVSRIGIVAAFIFAVNSMVSANGAEKPAEPVVEPAVPKIPRANPPLFVEVLDKCPLSQKGGRESPALLMLAGTLLKPLVEKAVPAAIGWAYDKGVNALEARNAKFQASSTAVTTDVFYDPAEKNYKFGCIVLMRATRDSRMENGVDYLRQSHGGTVSLPAGSPWAAENAKELAQLLHFSRAPEFYMEIALDSVRAFPEKDINVLNTIPTLMLKGKTSLTEAESKRLGGRDQRTMYRVIFPSRLDYLTSGAQKNGDDGGKNVSVEIHLDLMEANGEWKPFYTRTYDLGRQKQNSSDVNMESQGKDTFIPPQRRWSADGYFDPMPVRISATLTEMDENIDLGRALEAAFKDEQAKKSTVDVVAKVVVDKLQEKIDEKTGTTSTKKP